MDKIYYKKTKKRRAGSLWSSIIGDEDVVEGVVGAQLGFNILVGEKFFAQRPLEQLPRGQSVIWRRRRASGFILVVVVVVGVDHPRPPPRHADSRRCFFTPQGFLGFYARERAVATNAVPQWRCTWKNRKTTTFYKLKSLRLVLFAFFTLVPNGKCYF